MIGAVFAALSVGAAVTSHSTTRAKHARQRESFGVDASSVPPQAAAFIDSMLLLAERIARFEEEGPNQVQDIRATWDAEDKAAVALGSGVILMASSVMLRSIAGGILSFILGGLSLWALGLAAVTWSKKGDSWTALEPEHARYLLLIGVQDLRIEAKELARDGFIGAGDYQKAEKLLNQLQERLKQQEAFGAWATSLGSGYRDVFARKGQWPDPAGGGHRGTGRHAVRQHTQQTLMKLRGEGLLR